MVLVPIACLLALASCLFAGSRRRRGYFEGTTARTVLPLDVVTLLLAAAAAAGSLASIAPDEDAGVALLFVLVGALPALPLILRGRSRAMARVAVALVLSAWTIATGLSVGVLFLPAAFFSAGAVLFGVWTLDRDSVPG